MLLRRLVEYADATAGDDDTATPRYYARKPVRWLLDIDSGGKPLGGLTDTLDKTDQQRRFGVQRLVPSVTRTVGVAPALAADTIEYVFGWEAEGSKPDRVPKQHAAFQQLIQDWAKADPNGLAPTIAAFYREHHARTIPQPPDAARGDLVAIRVAGEYAAGTDSAIRYWATVAGDRKSTGQVGLCLVCGQLGTLLKTIPQQIPRRWLPGATQSASLVSVNIAVHGYELQKFLVNTPICDDCGLKFMSSLTTLLSSERNSHAFSGQHARLAWWIRGDSDLDPWAILDQPNDLHIVEILRGPAAGEAVDFEDSELAAYCSVTVGGNVARVVVRDWVEMPLTKVRDNIRSWLNDHEIADWTGEVVKVPLWRLAQATGRWEPGRGGAKGSWKKFGASGESRPEDVFHGLARSALLGTPLPPRLLAHVIHRITMDGRVDAARVALVRLALRRYPNLEPARRERLTPTLNPETPTPAYLSGRVFAVLDDLQRTVFYQAKQELNTTYAERNFGRAISNPQAVLVTGRRTATAWLRRLRGPLRRPTWANAYEKRLDDLFTGIAEHGGMPGAIILPQKAEFILGYHQQRATMRAERSAAAAGKHNSDLPPVLDDKHPASEGADA